MSDSMSWEEAKRLANELLRRPIDHFYAEHWRADNPAMRIFVKDVFQFTKMLERRGFDSIANYLDKNGWSCTAWSGGVQAMFAESFFMYETVAEVARRLDQFAGQHHMQHDCGFPLLREAKNTRDRATLAYRAASAGPASKSLLECPQCQQYIQDDSVKEINDVETANQPDDKTTE